MPHCGFWHFCKPARNGGRTSGKPAFLRRKMTRENTITDRRMRRYIRIRDMELWEKIDRIMEEPQYAKSFNKVINDALYYGLDELMRQLFETTETSVSEQIIDKQYIRRVDGVDETYFFEIARLLKEVIVNVTINKSMLASLFNVKARELNKESVSGKKYAEGRYAETPDYLVEYEIRSLRDLRE